MARKIIVPADKLNVRQIERLYRYFEQRGGGLLPGERAVRPSEALATCKRAGIILRKTFRLTMGQSVIYHQGRETLVRIGVRA